MSKNTDPAFPINREDVEFGISVRDYFAAAALPALIQGDVGCRNEASGKIVLSIAARKAYEIADLMIEERKL